MSLHLTQDQPALTSTIRRLTRLLRLSITHLKGKREESVCVGEERRCSILLLFPLHLGGRRSWSIPYVASLMVGEDRKILYLLGKGAR